MSSVGDLKNELTKMGLSTQTPGLSGDDRVEELKRRLEEARGKTRIALSVDIGSHSNGANNDATRNVTTAPPSISDLTISEIRSRLNALGENTNTPGLTGEERRAELMKRLVTAICGQSNDDSEDEEEGENRIKTFAADVQPVAGVIRPSSREKVASIAAAASAPPPKYVPPPPPKAPARKDQELKPQKSLDSVEIKVETRNKEQNEEDNTEEEQPVSQSEINELKKEITRISNKRAMLIAAKLSGSGQDQSLKDCEKTVSQADAELARLSVQKQRSKALGAEKASSLLVDGGVSMPLARLQSELEQLRSIAKDEVKAIRQRIREEADSHADYGVTAQNVAQAKLTDALLSQGRTRRKIHDIKTRGIKADISVNDENKTAVDQKSASAAAPLTKPTAATPSMSSTVPPKQNKPATTKAIDPFEKRMERMEVESERAMSGLDDLLAEMENEGSSQRFSDHALDEEDSPTMLSAARLRNKAKGKVVETSKVSSTSQAQERVALPAGQGQPPAAAGKSNSAAAAMQSNRRVSSPPPPERVIDDLEEEEEEEGVKNNGFDEDEDVPAPISDSPLKLRIPLGSLSSRLAPPDSAPPKEAQILPSPLKPKQTQGQQVFPFSAGVALRSGSHFESSGSEDEPTDNASNRRRPSAQSRPYSAASETDSDAGNARPQGPLRVPTATSSAPDKELDDDDELTLLLRKYPKQSADDDDDNEDEDDDDTDPLPSGRPKQIVKPVQVTYKAPTAFDFEKVEDFPTKSTVAPAPLPDSASNSSEQKSHSALFKLSASGSPGKKGLLSLPVIPAVPAIIRTSPISASTLDRDSLRSDNASFQDVNRLAGQPSNHQTPSKTASATAPKEMQNINLDDKHASETSDGENINEQLSALRRHARVLERLGDLNQAEKVYTKCLDIDPMDLKSLQGYATFLHQKKGDLSLAEAFFSRAIQVCVPGFLESRRQATGTQVPSTIEYSPTRQAALSIKPPSQVPAGRLPEAGADGMRIHTVARLLTKYADFVARAKGDSDGAIRAYRKAIELHPTNADTLATLGHFISEEGDSDSFVEALDLFARAMRADPSNAAHALKYARLLKKTGNIGKADLMYQVARTNSRGNAKLEPSALCNYATFVYRQRKNAVQAQELFLDGLQRFPDHKGLQKNYMLMLKANPSLGSAEIIPLKRNKEGADGSLVSNGEPNSAVSNPNTPPMSTKRAVARVHARMLLTTSGAPLGASDIVADAETPSKLKEDYNASLEHVRKNVKSWHQDELQAEEEQRKKDMQQMKLAELSEEFNSFFDATANNSVKGDDLDAEAGIYNDMANLSDSDEDSSEYDSDSELYAR